MADLFIQMNRVGRNSLCALCGKRISVNEGPQLVMADSLDVVCSECGKRHAPALLGLIQLAGVANRVGRIGRHTVFPPLASLLDLARAAEDYLHAAPPSYKQAV